MKQQIILSQDLESDLAKALALCCHDRIFVLTDEMTEALCWPLLSRFHMLRDVRLITIKASDSHKSLDSLVKVWTSLSNGGATRHSCLINLGGGMVTDLGGFAASTFKRGIDFIQIPTTLLAMVDASVGGKTGINFNGLKNEIGVFNEAASVLLNTRFLETLDETNIRSGYAEMLKHGLISNTQMWADLLCFDLAQPDLFRLQEMVGASVKVKENIVRKDPTERGIRKALNFGHTVGHAFEAWSLAVKRPLLHGYAVAFGLVCELYLSVVKQGFPVEKMRKTVRFINDYYGKLDFSCDDYSALIALMHHDKKNEAGQINFTLLADVGDIHINQTATEEEITDALDFYRDGT